MELCDDDFEGKDSNHHHTSLLDSLFVIDNGLGNEIESIRVEINLKMRNGNNCDEKLENIEKGIPINMEIHYALKNENEDEEMKKKDWDANVENIWKAHILIGLSMVGYMSNKKMMEISPMDLERMEFVECSFDVAVNGELMAQYLVHSEMESNEAVYLNTLILGYAQNGYDKEGTKLFGCMVEEDFRWNGHTSVGVGAYSLVVVVCAAKLIVKGSPTLFIQAYI